MLLLLLLMMMMLLLLLLLQPRHQGRIQHTQWKRSSRAIIS